MSDGEFEGSETMNDTKYKYFFEFFLIKIDSVQRLVGGSEVV